MKKRLLSMGMLLGAILLAAVPAASAVGSPTANGLRADATVLTVTGADGTALKYTLQQLKDQFRPFVGYAGYVKSGLVAMQAPRPVKGVLLTDLLKKVGYDSAANVTIAAEDDYSQLLSAGNVAGQDVNVRLASPPDYPTVTMPAGNPLTPILVYQEKTVAGAKVDDANPWEDYSTSATAGMEADGPLRFWYGYPNYSEPGYVTNASGCVRMVNRVNVQGAMAPEWTVAVKGPKRSFSLTQSQFRTWTAKGSYGERTVTVAGHTYTGLPLYIVVGTVDDGKKLTFNARLARKGYKIDVRNSTRKATIGSKSLAGRTKKIILAWKKDGTLLTGDDSPLWLVGGPIVKAKRISGITSITLRGVPK